MKKPKLGKSNLEVSALGYGCMGLSAMYGQPLPRLEGIQIIRAEPQVRCARSVVARVEDIPALGLRSTTRNWVSLLRRLTPVGLTHGNSTPPGFHTTRSHAVPNALNVAIGSLGGGANTNSPKFVMP